MTSPSEKDITVDAPGTVDVDLAPDGQPRYTIRAGAAWDRIEADALATGQAASAEAVCFGSLAQREEPSRRSIRSRASCTAGRCC